MKSIVLLVAALTGIHLSAPLSCEHFGFYGCSECSASTCSKCVSGWFLLPNEGGNFCVPSCGPSSLHYGS